MPNSNRIVIYLGRYWSRHVPTRNPLGFGVLDIALGFESVLDLGDLGFRFGGFGVEAAPEISFWVG